MSNWFFEILKVLTSLEIATSGDIGNLESEGRFRESTMPKKTTMVTNIPKETVIMIFLSINLVSGISLSCC